MCTATERATPIDVARFSGVAVVAHQNRCEYPRSGSRFGPARRMQRPSEGMFYRAESSLARLNRSRTRRRPRHRFGGGVGSLFEGSGFGVREYAFVCRTRVCQHRLLEDEDDDEYEDERNPPDIRSRLGAFKSLFSPLSGRPSLSPRSQFARSGASPHQIRVS